MLFRWLDLASCDDVLPQDVCAYARKRRKKFSLARDAGDWAAGVMYVSTRRKDIRFVACSHWQR